MRQYLLLILGVSIIFSGSAYAQNMQDVEIIISSSSYNYGEKLDYKIIVSEVTGEDAIIFITNTKNPLFQKEHVEEEIRTLGEKLIQLEEKKSELEQIIQEKTDRLRKAENADVKLKTHNISNETELEQIVETIKEKIKKAQY